MSLFRNHYRHCDVEWEDIWSCTSNDRCPVCNAEIEPYESEDVTPEGSLDDLNPAQRERLLDFIAAAGPDWKEELSRLWWDGKDWEQPNGHLLRQIRNHFGPQWLESLETP